MYSAFHLESFFAERDGAADPEHGYLRAEVREALESYLECGCRRFGFARLKCGSCGREKLLALSRAGRYARQSSSRPVTATWAAACYDGMPTTISALSNSRPLSASSLTKK